MKSIYKYTLPVKSVFQLQLPSGAKLLTVRSQYNTPQLWALVDPEASLAIFSFRLVTTGEIISYGDIIYNLDYLGTYELNDGTFIGHLWGKEE
jgi:hypothetical protein